MQSAEEGQAEWQKFITRFPTWQDYERHREERRARARRRVRRKVRVRAIFQDPAPEDTFQIQRLHETGWHIEGRGRSVA